MAGEIPRRNAQQPKPGVLGWIVGLALIFLAVSLLVFIGWNGGINAVADVQKVSYFEAMALTVAAFIVKVILAPFGGNND